MSSVAQQPDTPTLRMILVLTGIAMASGLLVMLAADFSAPFIAENQRVARELAAGKVIHGATSFQQWTLAADGKLDREGKQPGQPIYAGYDDQGKLMGLAVQSAAQGYSGMVDVLYGYDPSCQCVRGFEVLKMTETPGLGDKVLTDGDFLANFTALDARLNADQSAVANQIHTVKHGTKQHEWEIDAISGATITSKAIGKAIGKSTAEVLPKLIPQLTEVR